MTCRDHTHGAALVLAALALGLFACGEPSSEVETEVHLDAAARAGEDASVAPEPESDAAEADPAGPDASKPVVSHPDASAARHDAGVLSGWAVPAIRIAPSQIAPGGTVTVSTDVRSLGAATIADGIVSVEAHAPDGRTFVQKTTGVAVAAGDTATVDQQRGPYTVLGTWTFFPTFTDASGAVLARGPAAGASMTVKAAAGPVKVLLYSGGDASQNDVAGTKSALTQASTNAWIAGVTFVVTTTTTVSASTLSGQDVVILPGGDGGRAYLANSALSGPALRAFVSGGKGYLGTCAGAYAASAHVQGTLDGTTYDYAGWGLAPHVTAKPVGYIGQLPVAISTAGEPILGASGTLTLMHYRGPAMTASSPAMTLTTFADGKTGYPGAGNIVTDALGSGRTILCASHPEVAPVHPQLVARMVAWAAFRL